MHQKPRNRITTQTNDSGRMKRGGSRQLQTRKKEKRTSSQISHRIRVIVMFVVIDAESVFRLRGVVGNRHRSLLHSCTRGRSRQHGCSRRTGSVSDRCRCSAPLQKRLVMFWHIFLDLPDQIRSEALDDQLIDSTPGLDLRCHRYKEGNEKSHSAAERHRFFPRQLHAALTSGRPSGWGNVTASDSRCDAVSFATALLVGLGQAQPTASRVIIGGSRPAVGVCARVARQFLQEKFGFENFRQRLTDCPQSSRKSRLSSQSIVICDQLAEFTDLQSWPASPLSTHSLSIINSPIGSIQGFPTTCHRSTWRFPTGPLHLTFASLLKFNETPFVRSFYIYKRKC